MCGSAKKPVIVAPPVEEEAKEADEKATIARDDAKKKAQQMLGRKSTILTGSQGLTDEAVTRKKTLLGQ